MLKKVVVLLAIIALVYSQDVPQCSNGEKAKKSSDLGICGPYYNNVYSCCSKELVEENVGKYANKTECNEKLPDEFLKYYTPFLCFSICDTNPDRYIDQGNYVLCASYADLLYESCKDTLYCSDKSAECEKNSTSTDGCVLIKEDYPTVEEYTTQHLKGIYNTNETNCFKLPSPPSSPSPPPQESKTGKGSKMELSLICLIFAIILVFKNI